MDPIAVELPELPELPHAMAMIDCKGTDNSTSYAKGNVDDDVGGSAIRLKRWEGLGQSCVP